MTAVETVRIFIPSLGDAPPERALANRILARLETRVDCENVASRNWPFTPTPIPGLIVDKFKPIYLCCAGEGLRNLFVEALTGLPLHKKSNIIATVRKYPSACRIVIKLFQQHMHWLHNGKHKPVEIPEVLWKNRKPTRRSLITTAA